MKQNYWILLTIALLSGFTTMKAEPFFVKPGASGSGASWADACSLQDALVDAQDGDEIFVAKGTYTGSFKSRKLIKVYGNCDGTESVPPSINSAEGLETFLKGEQGAGKRVLYIDTKAAEWIGFDISGGDATEEATGLGRGGGVYINDNGGVLKYCRIHDNIGLDGSKGKVNTSGTPIKGVGGGAYVWNGKLENCIIENNIATKAPFKNDAGAWASGIGGGICLDATVGSSSEPDRAVVLNCIIRNNCTTPADDKDSYPSQGGGIAVKSGKLINSVIAMNNINGSKNNQNVGGGVACTEKVAFVINCTAVKNNVPGLGGGIGFQTTNADVTVTVANCIAWGNTSRDDSYGVGNENIRYGSSTDGALVGKVTISAVICPQAAVSPTAITSDPKFIDYANGIYSLQEGSPAIDAGDDPAIAGYDFDLAGNARIVGDAVDIGAYEYSGTNSIRKITDTDGEIIKTIYYTLQGVEIARPTTPGIYIVKNTYASQKEMINKEFINVK